MQLSRKRVIAAAMGLIEAEGVEATSMPRLATELGCGVIALYNYVSSKNALLDAVADELTSGIGGAAVPDASWQDQLREQARAFRATGRAHPRCMMAAASRRPVPVSMLRQAERALAVLREAGFSGPEAMRIVRAIAAYLLGSLLLEAGVAPGLTDGDGGHSAMPRLRGGEFRQLADLCSAPPADDPDGDFEFGLDLLVRLAAD